MKRSPPVSEADVFRAGEHVETIQRTPTGSIFRYTDAFHRAHANEPGGIALHLPYRPREIESRGFNLHPYFAGLLPEGLRLKALVRRAKTSEDDMLTLLVAAGTDTVGDVSVAARGARPTMSTARINPTAADQVSFAELWARTIETGLNETPIPGVQEKHSPAMISFPIASHSSRAAYILKLVPRMLAQLEQIGLDRRREADLRRTMTKRANDLQ